VTVASFDGEDFPHDILPQDHPEVVERCLAIDEALQWLDRIKQGDASPSMLAQAAELTKATMELLPDPDQFTAGGLTRYYHVWKHLLGPYEGQRRHVRWLLDAIRSGISWDTAVPLSQKRMPDHKHRLDRVRRMITVQLGAETAQSMLSSSVPQRLECPNHKSAGNYPEFVSETVVCAGCGVYR
jgi:hypothetical protein